VLGTARVAAELAYDLLVAVGHSRATFWLQGLWTASLIPALTIGAALDGFRGVAIGHAVVAMVLVMPAFALAVRRAGIRLRPLASGLVRPVAAGAAVAVTSVGAMTWIDGAFLELAVAGVAGLAVWAVIVAPLREQLRTARNESGPAETSAGADLPSAAGT
jgi:PST family polysaccharide transporter